MTTTDSSAPTAVLHGIRPGRPAAKVAASPAVRVLLADSQGLVRAGYRLLLEATERISVVGEAASGEEAVAIAHRLRPDVALIDATLPGLDSVQSTRQISSQSRVAVILLIASHDDENILPALRAGATGLLLRDTEPAELVRAVETVARGEALLSPRLTGRLIAELASRPEPASPSLRLLDELTAREREVVALVGHGLGNDEIAKRLVVSLATAKTHVSRAMVKLNAHNRGNACGVRLRDRAGAPPHRHSHPYQSTARDRIGPADWLHRFDLADQASVGTSPAAWRSVDIAPAFRRAAARPHLLWRQLEHLGLADIAPALRGQEDAVATRTLPARGR